MIRIMGSSQNRAASTGVSHWFNTVDSEPGGGHPLTVDDHTTHGISNTKGSESKDSDI